jgi:selenocysteine lyase/cysteine desulfurase
MTQIAEFERTLSAALLDAVESIPGAVVHGVSDRKRLSERVPTVCFTVAGVESATIAGRLSDEDIGVRFGHMYTPRLLTRLGLLPGGVVRASLVHYNTLDEIARFRESLARVIAQAA